VRIVDGFTDRVRPGPERAVANPPLTRRRAACRSAAAPGRPMHRHLAFLALFLAGPALADAPGSPSLGAAPRGPEMSRRVVRPHPHAVPHRDVGARRFARPPRRGHPRFVGHGFASVPSGEPVAYAWPDTAEVRVPIYNRPSHRPPAW
jgi:hypothetical protein